MNATQFHLEKENQIKDLAGIVRSAKISGFKADVREAIVKTTQKAIDCLVKMRHEVYVALEGFDKYEHNHVETKAVEVENEKEAARAEYRIKSLVAAMKEKNKKVKFVINTEFKKYIPTKTFEKAAADFEKSLDKIMDAFPVAENKEEEKGAAE